jgi:hypothetical protein
MQAKMLSNIHKISLKLVMQTQRQICNLRSVVDQLDRSHASRAPSDQDSDRETAMRAYCNDLVLSISTDMTELQTMSELLGDFDLHQIMRENIANLQGEFERIHLAHSVVEACCEGQWDEAIQLRLLLEQSCDWDRVEDVSYDF